MTCETAHKILSVHQAWRRGLVDTMEYTAAEVNEALQLAITALQSDRNAPEWNQAPDWAQWFEIDEKGLGFWHENEPVKNGDEYIPSPGRIQNCGKLILPLLVKRPK